MAEGLLHHHATGLGQTGGGELTDHGTEQKRGNLQVEHGIVGVADGRHQALVGGGVGEVAADVGQALCEAIEHLGVHRLAGAFDALTSVVAQMFERPIVARDADDRAVQQPPALEAIERAKRHHSGEVAGDAEHDEHVSGLRVLGVRHAPTRAVRPWHAG